jgi:hypothetical protein
MLFYAGRKQTHIFESGILLVTVPSKRVKETDEVIRGVKRPHTD